MDNVQTPGGNTTTAGAVEQMAVTPDFQAEVGDWMLACFGSVIAADLLERADRFTEEALELAQTMPGFNAERAHALVDYVFSRPVGERGQEVGGVMVTLAALCNPVSISIRAEAERELARIWTKVDAIRAKQASKPTGSALPVAVPSALSANCAARNGGTGANDPQDCDWPVCGCDPHADKVIAALQESGLMVASSAETYAANMKAAGEKIGRDLFDQARAATRPRRGLPIPSALSGDAGEERFAHMKAEEARIMQDWRWGNLTKLGVANHLRRAGFDLRYATDKANALTPPAVDTAFSISKRRYEERTAKPGFDIDGVCIEHGRFCCSICRVAPQLKVDLPADVVRLVIAARVIAFNDWDGDSEEWVVARKELDDASEAFASRLPWDDEPAALPSHQGAGE